MIELSTIRDLVGIASFIIALLYYILNIQNQRETRRIQLAQNIAQRTRTPEHGIISLELYDMIWTDFDDFLSKYDSTVNPENYVKRNLIFGMLEEGGYMLKKGMIDMDTMYNLGNPRGNMVLWEKFKPVFYAYRERYNDPDLYRWFEYLIEEYRKERVRRGLQSDITDADRAIHQRYTDN